VRSRIEKGKKIKAKTRCHKKQVSSPNVQHPNKGSTITVWEIQPEWGKAKQNNPYGAREECKSANSIESKSSKKSHRSISVMHLKLRHAVKAGSRNAISLRALTKQPKTLLH
jgi:hypothetical protein